MFPVLLGAAALVWLAAEWNSPGAGAAFTLGLLLYAAWPPCSRPLPCAAWTSGRSIAASIVVLAASFAVSVGLLGLASAAVFDPTPRGAPSARPTSFS